MKMKFSDWLIEEMKGRDWSNSELARRAKITRQAVGYYVGGRIPDSEAIEKIAKALGYPLETVYRAAGILPPEAEKREILEKIRHELERLSDIDLERWWMRIKAEKEINNKLKKPPKK
jgi:transcriptional regulator with XRE-family HTH domain